MWNETLTLLVLSRSAPEISPGPTEPLCASSNGFPASIESTRRRAAWMLPDRSSSQIQECQRMIESAREVSENSLLIPRAIENTFLPTSGPVLCHSIWANALQRRRLVLKRFNRAFATFLMLSGCQLTIVMPRSWIARTYFEPLLGPTPTQDSTEPKIRLPRSPRAS